MQINEHVFHAERDQLRWTISVFFNIFHHIFPVIRIHQMKLEVFLSKRGHGCDSHWHMDRIAPFLRYICFFNIHARAQVCWWYSNCDEHFRQLFAIPFWIEGAGKATTRCVLLRKGEQILRLKYRWRIFDGDFLVPLIPNRSNAIHKTLI